MKIIVVIPFLLCFFNCLVSNAQWASLGPYGGPANALIAVNDTVFAGSDNGIFKTINNGDTWQRESNGMPIFFKIKKFLYLDSILFAATDIGIYIYSSVQHQWTLSNNSPANVVDLVATQFSEKKILYATDGRILYSSDNKGKSWLSILPPSYNTSIVSLGTLNNTLYFTDNSTIFFSSDQKSWSKMTSVFQYSFRGFVEKKDTLFFNTAGMFFYILKNSTTFNGLKNPLNTFMTGLFLLNDDVYTATYSGLLGKAPFYNGWNPDTLGLAFGGLITCAAASPKYMYTSNSKGIWRRSVKSNKWIPLNEGLVNATITGLFKSANTIWAGTNGNAYKTQNNGKNWEYNNNGFPDGANISGYVEFKNVLHASTILSGYNDYTGVSFPGGLYSYNTKTLTWSADTLFSSQYKKDLEILHGGSTFGFDQNVTALQSTRDYLFAATDLGVYQTKDGATWAMNNDGLKGIVRDFAVNNSNDVFAITDSNAIFQLLNNAVIWKKIPDPPKAGKLHVVDCFNNILFLGTDHGLFIFDSKLNSWKKSGEQTIKNAIHSIASVGHQLYIGGLPGKVYRSVDIGLNWTDISIDLPANISIEKLIADTDYIYGGTKGNSVWRLPVALFYPSEIGTGSLQENTATSATIGGVISYKGYSTFVEIIFSTDSTFIVKDSIPASTNPIITDNAKVTFGMTSLLENTTYYYRLKGTNSAGIISYGEIRSFRTAPFTFINSTVSRSKNLFPEKAFIDSTQGNKVSTTTSPVVGIALNQNIPGTIVHCFYRSITKENVIDTLLTSSSNIFTFKIPAASFDEIGVEYYFLVEPPKGYSSGRGMDTHSDTLRTAVHYPRGINVPGKLRTGADSKSYNLLSFPFVLKDNKSGSIVYKAVGVDKPDDTKYRFLTYVGNNGNYKNIWKINPETIESGISYWFATRELKATLNTGEGSTVANHPSFDGKFYSILLDTGYNQIGNPFLMNISWSDVLASSGNPNLGPLIGYAFQGDSVRLMSLSNLSPFSGGYVNNKNNNPVFLKIPAKKNTILNTSRIGKEEGMSMHVSFILESGMNRMELGGLGIHRNSLPGLDEFDTSIPPMPIGFPMLEFNDQHGLTSSIVPEEAQGQYWQFSVSGAEEKKLSNLKWTMANEIEGKELILEDQTHHEVVNMSDLSAYYFKGTSNFKIYFGTKEYIEKRVLINDIHIKVYPCPVEGKATISFVLPESKHEHGYKIKLSMLDLNGKPIKTFTEQIYSGGLYKKEMEDIEGGPGVRIIELLVDESDINIGRYYSKVVFK